MFAGSANTGKVVNHAKPSQCAQGILHGHTHQGNNDDRWRRRRRRRWLWLRTKQIRFLVQFCFFFVFEFAFGRGEWWSEAERVHPTKIFLRKKQLKRILILYRFKSNKHHICSSICSLILHTFFVFLSFLHEFYVWFWLEWLCFGCDTYMRARRDIRSHYGLLVCMCVRE